MNDRVNYILKFVRVQTFFLLSAYSGWLYNFLPPFYRSLLLAWRACKGSFQASTLGIGSGTEFCPVSSMTTRSAYLFLLSENAVVPHCETKFFPLFGSLYWSWTWRQLFYFDLDRSVIDLAWKISHWVPYTAERLASFGYDLSTTCFFSHPMESLQHLFFYCPLAVSILSWVQSLMFLASPLCPTLLLRHALFGFSSNELLVVPKVFCYLLNVSKFYIWVARNGLGLGFANGVLVVSWLPFGMMFSLSTFSLSLSCFLVVCPGLSRAYHCDG